MKFVTGSGAATFSTRDGTVYAAQAGVFTIPNPTHQDDALQAGFTETQTDATDPANALAADTADVAAGGDAEVTDNAAALAAAQAAANVDTQMPPE